MMTSERGIHLEYFLALVVEEANNAVDSEDAYLDEMLPAITSIVHEKEGGEIYERFLSEQTVARLRSEIIQIDDKLSNLFDKPSKSLLDDLFLQTPWGERTYITQGQWDEIEKYCRSILVFDRYILLLNISSEILKIRSAELVNSELLEKEYGGKAGLNWLLDNKPISSEHRPTILMKTGVIGSDLEQDIKSVNDMRNNAIHDLDSRYNLPSPNKILTDIDTAVSAIERIDKHLGYSPDVRLYVEDSLNDVYYINPDEIDTSDIESFDDLTEEIRDMMLMEGMQNEDAYLHTKFKEIVDDDEEFVKILERTWRNDLRDKEGDELKEELLITATVYRDHLGINFFKRLKEHKDRFEERIPSRYFEDDLINKFEPE